MIMLGADAAKPYETGGVLVGYQAPSTHEMVITAVVGPGPAARGGRDYFLPDVGFHQREVARLYEESGRTIEYLGDWHSHPLGSAWPSRLDRRTLRRVASSLEARAPEPVMGILAGNPDWSLFVWQWRPHEAGRGQRLRPLRTKVYNV